MNKLSKAQREQLMLIAMVTVGVMGLLWYFVILTQQRTLKVTREKAAETQIKMRDAEALMQRGTEIDGTLHLRSQLLAQREAGLPPDRDAYAWLINTMNSFLQSRKGVSIDTYSQPDVSENGLIPKFPYSWATFKIKGTGYYHDLGNFIADFENTFPYFRVQNVNLSANSGPGMEAEKLSVTFDIVAPVASRGPATK